MTLLTDEQHYFCMILRCIKVAKVDLPMLITATTAKPNKILIFPFVAPQCVIGCGRIVCWVESKEYFVELTFIQRCIWSRHPHQNHNESISIPQSQTSSEFAYRYFSTIYSSITERINANQWYRHAALTMFVCSAECSSSGNIY